MKAFNTLLLLACSWAFAQANTPLIIEKTLDWAQAPQSINLQGYLTEYWAFEGAVPSDDAPGLPFFTQRFPVEGPGKLRVQVLEAVYEPLPWQKPPPSAEALEEQPQFTTGIARQREGYFGNISFVPIIRRGGSYERLVSFRLRVTLAQSPIAVRRDPGNTQRSELSDGEIYKVAVSETGIHKLTYAFLKDELGMDIDNINPAQIKVLGISGGKLPYYSEAPRADDLPELPVHIEGGGDGAFNSGDYLLFYAEGPDTWRYNPERRQFEMEQNIYSFKTYYYIKVGSGPGQRISEKSSVNAPAYTVTTFNAYSRFEQERVNLLHEWSKAQGSGKHWYGDQFKGTRQYDYGNIVDFPNLVQSAPVYIQARAALRARLASPFFVDIAGQELRSSNASAVPNINASNDNITFYAHAALLRDSLFLNSDQAGLRIRYPHPQGPGDDSEGWVDWVQFNARRQLIMTGSQMGFRDVQALGAPNATFQLSGAGSDVEVWDVTDPLQPQRQQASRTGNALSFGTAIDSTIREYIAFEPAAALLQPEAVGPVPNQNLHGISSADMLIVHPAEFEQEALRLAQHRADNDGLEVLLATPEQIFNEFGGGRPEPTAIRDFCRMIYSRSPKFKYLLLLGDASFDNRDIYGLGGNFIPVYQREDFNPVNAFPTDDFVAILYSDNDANPLMGELQLAVGRIPAKTADEAAKVIDKIIHYDSSPRTLGDWRNRLAFVGDDKDSQSDAAHYQQADRVAEEMQGLSPFLNNEKIHLDAFPVEVTPGGRRFPLATERLNQAVFKGALAVTFFGHGGPRGWSQERVLNISDIVQWDNLDNMPIFMTATCSFTGYDDPSFVSAGEEVILNPKGGGIALMTTVRAVFTSGNELLTRSAMKYMVTRNSAGQPYTLGEASRSGKNDLGFSAVNNSRKFALIGDPAMPIALPTFNVQTTSINGKTVNPLDSLPTDTLRALQNVTIEGVVTDVNGQVLQDFNGIVYPTVFDKAQRVNTLGQGPNPVFNYRVQNNVLFRGRASVANGRFEFTFVVPKDINYELGLGKLSYYAADESQLIDATGSYENVVIGGTDLNAVVDDQGPEVEVFMNTEDFVFGSVVDPGPTLLVRLSDDNGINVVGNSIGHDLEGVLNGNTQNTYLLNDFYESELDDHTKGMVRFPMRELPEGRHRIEVKAWDVANNSAVGYTEFIVASSGEVALQRVLNYPNPFTDRTCFQFDHNLANQEIDVLIQIYTVSGRLVKTLERSLFSDGALRLDDCIDWDGRDDFGDQLARGVYLYKVKVRALGTGLEARLGESDFEKLVILK